jgi:hypothetical protein
VIQVGEIDDDGRCPRALAPPEQPMNVKPDVQAGGSAADRVIELWAARICTKLRPFRPNSY